MHVLIAGPPGERAVSVPVAGAFAAPSLLREADGLDAVAE
jgi:hypothetical protein